MPTFTFGMIVKNEEKFLPACLESIKDFADEIIIVDTGSTDKTVEIAESFGAKIIHHNWEYNMSKARDEYIKAATKDWILSLDADERISKSDLGKLKEIISTSDPKIKGFFLTKRDYGFEGREKPSDDPYDESKPYKTWMEVKEIRLFANDKKLHYSHHVHTNLIPSIQKLKYAVADLNGIPIHHFRQELTKEQKDRKRKLYIQMLKLEVMENPNDPSAYGHLAAEYGPQEPERAIETYEKAVTLIKKNKEKGKNPWSFHFVIVGQLGRIYMEQKNLEKAKELFKMAIDLGTKDPYHYSLLGEIEFFEKDFENAKIHFLKAKEMGHQNKPYINSRLTEISPGQVFF